MTRAELEKKRDELADAYYSTINEEYSEIEQANMPYTITEQSFSAGFDSAIKLMSEREKRLVNQLKACHKWIEKEHEMPWYSELLADTRDLLKELGVE